MQLMLLLIWQKSRFYILSTAFRGLMCLKSKRKE